MTHGFEIREKQDTALRLVAKAFEWGKWSKELPYLDFDKDWLVRAIPAFGTGIIRYNIKHKENPNAHVSIYFDAYDRAGYMKMQPYWELFPYDEGCFRCYIHETDKLIEAIRKSFEEQQNEATTNK